jgi:1-acyl-sn-glycerol-3-phosphate acyltransferase
VIYYLGKIIFTFYFYVFNRLKISGKENIVKDGPCIVFGNHYSNFDVFLLNIAYKRQIHFMAKKSLFHIPVIKYFVKAYGAFPIDRNNTDITAIKTALRILKDNKVLGMFPEGHRTKEESDSDAKGGIVMLAYKSKAVLQPIRLKYKRKFYIFYRIDIIIGKPILWSDLGIKEAKSDEYKRIGTELLEQVYNL